MTKRTPSPNTKTQRFDACAWRNLVGPGYQFSTHSERMFERPVHRHR